MSEHLSVTPGAMSRRALSRSMAWTVPALAIAAAAPAMAASVGDVSVRIVSCTMSQGRAILTFEVCATTVAAAKDSTFNLSGTGSWSASVSGTFPANAAVQPGTSNPRTFALTTALATGACYQLVLTFSSWSAGSTATFATGARETLMASGIVIAVCGLDRDVRHRGDLQQRQPGLDQQLGDQDAHRRRLLRLTPEVHASG